MNSRRAVGFIAVLIAILTYSVRLSAQDSSPTFRVSTNLVLSDVEVYDTKSGQPIQELSRDDFRVLDNREEVSLTAVDTGAYAKPIVLWLTVICNEKGGGEFASEGFSGHEAQLRPSLERLMERDRVAVAEWCDDGDAKAVLLPTHNRDTAIVALKRALAPIDFVKPAGGQLRRGELALQGLLRGIIDEAERATPSYLPVIVFLHGDWTGAPKPEIDSILSNLLETQSIVYGIKNKSVPEFVNHYPGEMSELFHYLAESTGGQYLAVDESAYASALATIIDRVHFRYQLSFRPKALDGKRHELKIQLSDEARQKYKHARIRARREYIAKKN